MTYLSLKFQRWDTGDISYEIRYRWEGSSLQMHSKLTAIGEDKAQTEIVFFENNKEVSKVIVPTYEVEETIIDWDKR